VLVDGAEVSTRVAQATGNAKIALAIDGVGGEAMLSLSSCLRPGGTLVLYYAVSSKPSLASFVDLVYRNVTIRGFWFANPEFHTSPKLVEAIKTGARLIAEGKLHMLKGAARFCSNSHNGLIPTRVRREFHPEFGSRNGDVVIKKNHGVFLS